MRLPFPWAIFLGAFLSFLIGESINEEVLTPLRLLSGIVFALIVCGIFMGVRWLGQRRRLDRRPDSLVVMAMTFVGVGLVLFYGPSAGFLAAHPEIQISVALTMFAALLTEEYNAGCTDRWDHDHPNPS